MKKIVFTFLSALILLAAFNGCSKKGADKLVGKWKAETGVPNFEVTYEFTKTNMTIEFKGPDMPAQKVETTYTVKSDDGENMVIEVIHPVTKIKGDFKLVIKDKNIDMTDPDGQPTKLTKM